MRSLTRFIRLTIAYLAACYVAALVIILGVAYSAPGEGALAVLTKSALLAVVGALTVAWVALIPSALVIAITEWRRSWMTAWVLIAFAASAGFMAAIVLPPGGDRFVAVLYPLGGAAAGATYWLIAGRGRQP